MSQLALLEAFAEGSIALDVAAANREEAIRKVGQLLFESGRTTVDYSEEMVDALEEFGPYFVLAPGIAIAHARPSASVKSVGLALAVLRDPIEFGSEGNDPVRLLFALCATDHDSHIDVLAGLAELLMDGDKVNFLLNASTVDQIRNLLSGGLRE